MSTWIKLDDDTFAQEASPDPAKILNTAGIQELITNLNYEIKMHQDEINMLTSRLTELQSEVAEMEGLIQ